jgi:hypothetical protein
MTSYSGHGLVLEGNYTEQLQQLGKTKLNWYKGLVQWFCGFKLNQSYLYYINPNCTFSSQTDFCKLNSTKLLLLADN